MMEFDKYSGPVFLTTANGWKDRSDSPSRGGLPHRSHSLHSHPVSPIVCYDITVHKSQSITEDMIVTDLSSRDFQTGLSDEAVSRVKTLQGLMLDVLRHLIVVTCFMSLPQMV